MQLIALCLAYLCMLVQPTLTFRPAQVTKIGKRSYPVPAISAANRQDLVAEETVLVLEKLLKQQKAELAETEKLLHAIRSTSVGDHKQISSDILSTAASVAAGFDYGFSSRSDGPILNRTIDAIGGLAYGGPPANLWTIGTKQFWRNWNAMKGEYEDEDEIDLTPKQRYLRSELEKLTLNSTEIWAKELADGPIVAPWIIKVPYLVVCYLLDVLFAKEYVFSRFFLLETVARMPYFSYITMLHLYETLGFWRRSADMKRVHFAEEINEFKHLLIMESLGGDQKWWVRFLAQHSAIIYYVVLCVLWALSPSLSYRFSELLETHAVNTYSTFLEENEARLKQLPPSVAAIEYYALGTSDSFYAEFQTSALVEGKEIRRPGSNMTSLYGVFRTIRDDEADHANTMGSCLDPNSNVRSLSVEKKLLTSMAILGASSLLLYANELNSVSGTADIAADVATDAATVGGDSFFFDAAAASAIGMIQSLFGEESEEVILGAGRTEEAGAFLQVVLRGTVEVLEAVGRFFLSIL